MNSENRGQEIADPAPSLDAALFLALAKSSLDSAIGAALSRVGLSLDDLRWLRIIGTHPRGLTREYFALTDSGRALIDQAEGLAEKAAGRWFAETGLNPTEVLAIAASGSGSSYSRSR